MVYLVSGICVVNVVLWIVFFVKFNKRFSTQKVIEQTRADMNDLVKDMQRNTAKNIDLINASIEKLRQVNAEADQKINQLNKKLELINSDIAAKNGVEQIRSAVQNGIAKQNHPSKNRSFGTDSGTVSPRQKNNISGVDAARRNQAVYPPINHALAYQMNKISQRGLFDDGEFLDNDEFVVNEEGAAYKEVPVITAKVLDDKAFAKSKEKSINEKVMDLYNVGNTVEDIATELSISLTEVQLIIDLGN